MLTLLDEYMRQCLSLHVDRSIREIDVIAVVQVVMKRFGTPQHLRSDNGLEFIAYDIQDWLQNECLNREIFGNLLEARVVIESWKCE